MPKYYGCPCEGCGEPLTLKDDIVVCPDCGAPYHPRTQFSFGFPLLNTFI